MFSPSTSLFRPALALKAWPERAAAVLAALSVFLVPVVAVSQSSAAGAGARATDVRFQPWVGCWTTVVPEGNSAPEDMPTRACVVPSSEVPGSVDVQMFLNDSLLSSNPLPLPGVGHARLVDGCTGEESSEWVNGGTRLILRGDLNCPGNVQRTETGLMAMTPDGHWLQLQNLKLGERQITTAMRFRFDVSRGLPQGIPLNTVQSNFTLRMTTGSSYSLDDVLDLGLKLPPAVTEVWLSEVGMPFKLTGKTIVQLADRGMPPSVIDMMVALDNPDVFAVRSGGMGEEQVSNSAIAMRPMETADSRSDRCGYRDAYCYGPGGRGMWGMGWGWGYNSYWSPYWGWSGSPYYGYDIYGRPIRYGPSWPSYWPGGVYYGGGPVVVIARPSSGKTVERGRYVKGKGYSSDRDRGSGSSAPRPAASPDTRRAGQSGASGSSSSGSAGSASGSGSSSSGTTERTAKPRRPPGSNR